MSNDKLAATFHGEERDCRECGPQPGWHAIDSQFCGVGLGLPEGDHVIAERPDLTPEQDLREAVAEILADIDHFTGCHRYVEGDGRCTCLVGRLDWAINAEQITEPRQDGAA